jgi:hypothetical protein
MLDLDWHVLFLKYRFQAIIPLIFHCYGRNPANIPRNGAKTKVRVKEEKRHNLRRVQKVLGTSYLPCT